MKSKIILLFIILGLLLRVSVSIFYTYGDMNVYFVPWVKNINNKGFSDFYKRVHSANYPPLAVYSLYTSYNLGNYLANPIMNSLKYLNNNIRIFPSNLILFLNTDKIIYSFMKLPFFIADIFLSLGIFFWSKKLVKKRMSKLPLLLFCSILFNPALIYNSALWGQIDIIPIAFITWSFYFLFEKNFIISSLLFTFGLLSKQTIGYFIPIFIILFLQNVSIKKLIYSFIMCTLFFYILFYPFYKTGNVLFFPFYTYIKIATQFGGNVLSAHALNLWWMLTNKAHLPDSTRFFNLASANVIGNFIILIQIIPIIFFMFKKHNKLIIIHSLALISICIFLFSTKMHERHLIPALPFLALLTLIDKRLFYIYLFFSLIIFANLYASWGQPSILFIYDFLNNAKITNVIILSEIIMYLILFAFFFRKLKIKNIINSSQNN